MTVFSLRLDVPDPLWGWQNMASPVGEELVFFHDLFMWVAVSMIFMVGGLILFVSQTNRFSIRRFSHDFWMELWWTLLPACILVVLGMPGFRLLYMMDDLTDSQLTIKVVGHQWYWSYEMEDLSPMAFDSYMIPLGDLEEGGFRLLEVDSPLVIPWGITIKAVVSAADVLHSWAIPSLGVKIDAVPGRLNAVTFHCNRMGRFYGQCSELCGVNHAFMPIVIQGMDKLAFLAWIQQNGCLNWSLPFDIIMP